MLKKSLLKIVIFIIVLANILFTNVNLFAQEFETVDWNGNAGEWSSIVLDTDGFPHISYSVDLDKIRRLNYARWDGEKWIREEIDRDEVGKYNHIDLDNDDLPHIAYWDQKNRDVKYAHFDGNSWHIETIQSYGDVLERYAIDLKVDSKGSPHICYTFKETYNNYKNLVHAYWDGEKWNKETIRRSEADQFGEYLSMVLDKYDLPHIAYYIARPYGGLIYSRLENSSWLHTRVDIEGASGKNTSIALDRHGYPHISYWRDYGWIFKYAYFNGINWNVSTIGEGSVSSLKMDKNDYPHINYMKHIGGGDHRLYYKYQNEAGWHEKIIRYSGTRGTISLALDYYDYPHTTFWNTENFVNNLTIIKPDMFGPQAFSLLYPENGEWGNAQDEFRWYPASYQGKGLSHYELWIDNNLFVNNIKSSRPFTKIETPLSDGWRYLED